MVPLLDMVNHGYEHSAQGGNDGIGGGGGVDALRPEWDAARGTVVIKAGVSLPGPGYEVGLSLPGGVRLVTRRLSSIEPCFFITAK
jgi:hypothetical protein